MLDSGANPSLIKNKSRFGKHRKSSGVQGHRGRESSESHQPLKAEYDTPLPATRKHLREGQKHWKISTPIFCTYTEQKSDTLAGAGILLSTCRRSKAEVLPQGESMEILSVPYLQGPGTKVLPRTERVFYSYFFIVISFVLSFKFLLMYR